METAPSAQYVSPTSLRHKFSQSMSQIYQTEVPLYSDLLTLVSQINTSILSSNPTLHTQLQTSNQLTRLNYERHGAIRLGTPQELHTMARFLAQLGMVPVGFYDLSQPPACLPIYATCFRTLDLNSLNMNPFRLFISLLRPQLIPDSLRQKAMDILSRRQIFHADVLRLLTKAEQVGGLTPEEGEIFLARGLETFKWRSHATVTQETYDALLAESPLLADIVGFQGPHINHLTPRTLDIDSVQARMLEQGIPSKESIEGPPRRECPILLRQTSFQALEEPVYFLGETNKGCHKARFGEVEQRGAALTKEGRKLYDELISEVNVGCVGLEQRESDEFARKVFERFPDDWAEIRRKNLAWFRYFVTSEATGKIDSLARNSDIEDLIELGLVGYEPFVYEDFLPLSAAGIFRSNLGSGSEKLAGTEITDIDGKEELELAIGRSITDEMEAYSTLQEESLETCSKHFGIGEDRCSSKL